ncbi:MAG TPA: hypothetical protein VNX88_12975 [Terriglobales bacterium]|nr:hypothetical protein [Terriglobales bacterium]
MFHSSTSEKAVFAYRRELRKAWDTPDARARDWYIFQLRFGHAALERSLKMRENPLYPMEEALLKPRSTPAGKPGAGSSETMAEWLFEPPPQATPLEAALFHFSKIGDRAKHCGYTDCHTPYFIAEKRWQKFCSEACAGPANREAKRKWWSENRGKESQQ